MKRMISIVLAAAMLLSLISVSAFAQTSADSVHINFTVPSVGDTMITAHDTITTSPNVMCNISAVFTGDDIEKIKKINTLDELNSYINDFTFPTEVYTNQQYLIVIMLSSGSVELSTETTPTFEEGVTGEMLVDGDYSVYAYLLFEPTLDESEGDNADNNTSDTTSSKLTQNVSVSYNKVVSDKIYSFDIIWQAMRFTYTPDTKVIWNPATHEYDSPAEAGWHSETNEIIVKNHSDFAIHAKFEYAPEPNFTGITGSFLDANGDSRTNDTFSVASAVDTEVEDPPSTSVFLTLDGILAADTIEGTKSGTVTITIQ